MADAFADQVVRVLEPMLGPHTAVRALDMIGSRLGREVASLTIDDAEAVLAILVPVVRNLLGREAAESLRTRVLAIGGTV